MFYLEQKVLDFARRGSGKSWKSPLISHPVNSDNPVICLFIHICRANRTFLYSWTPLIRVPWGKENVSINGSSN